MLKFRELYSFAFWRDFIKIYHLKGAFLVVVVFISIFWQIGTYSAGLSKSELTQYQASQSLNTIYENPVNAPYKLVEYGFIKLGLEKNLASRLPSAFVAVTFVLALYITVRKLLGRFYAGMCLFLLIGTPLFLILSRSGSGNNAILMIMTCGAALYLLTRRFSNPSYLLLLLVTLTLVTSFYVAGVLWYLLLFAFIYRNKISKHLTQIQRNRLILFSIVLLTLLAPLILALASSVTVFKEWLMLPAYMPAISEFAMRIIWYLPSIVIVTRDYSEFNVGTEPLINIALLAIVTIGLAASFMQGKELLSKLKLFIIISFLLYLLTGRFETLIVIVPVVVVLATTGLKYLYKEWKNVFPNNPIPKELAFFMISFVCILQAFYGFHVAHRVWPATTETKKLYVIK